MYKISLSVYRGAFYGGENGTESGEILVSLKSSSMDEISAGDRKSYLDNERVRVKKRGELRLPMMVTKSTISDLSRFSFSR